VPDSFAATSSVVIAQEGQLATGTVRKEKASRKEEIHKTGWYMKWGDLKNQGNARNGIPLPALSLLATAQ